MKAIAIVIVACLLTTLSYLLIPSNVNNQTLTPVGGGTVVGVGEEKSDVGTDSESGRKIKFSVKTSFAGDNQPAFTEEPAE